MSPPKVAIIIYSLYGNISQMAEAVKAGIVSAGGNAQIFQVPETLSEEYLISINAAPKPDYPMATPETLATVDAFLLGIPTRHGIMPAPWKAFWDATGGLWVNGDLADKYAGIFVSTDTPNGGQETTVMTTLTTLVHHGINYVPFGYSRAFAEMTSFEMIRGGSAWGAGTYSGIDGSRTPNKLEVAIAEKQGHAFWKTISKVNF